MTASRQPRTKNTKDKSLPYIWTFLERGQVVPAWGDPKRTQYLRDFAKTEPILIGAIFSMISKMVSSEWKIVGGRNKVARFHDLLINAEDGEGWGYFIDRLVRDYLETDLGGIVELGRLPGGPVGGLYNVDAQRVELTGNTAFPIKYRPEAGGVIPFSPDDFARIVDMPSPDESKFGLGFCAVSRAHKVARVLLALYNYEEEHLLNLPPQGIATITGLTMDEVQEAFDLYDQMRAANKEMTFKGVLWLAALDNPLQQVKVDLTPFSTLPEHFNKEVATSLYVFTLALDFGVDVREFWPASQVGATKAEAEVQASKAKTKGPGRLYASIERMINHKVLPPGITFKFVRKDAEEEMARAVLQGVQIKNIKELWLPASFSSSTTESGSESEQGGSSEGTASASTPLTQESGESQTPVGAGPKIISSSKSEGLITRDEARRLLVEQGVLPEWINNNADESMYGMEKSYLGPGEELVEAWNDGRIVKVYEPKAYAVPLSDFMGASHGIHSS